MWSDRSTISRQPILFAAIIAICLLAPFLGGSTTPWAQGIICIAIGLTIWCFPPRHQLQPIFYLLLLLLLLVPLTAFLPANWFGIPAWRATLVRDLQIPLPSTLSPQPWLSAECWVLMVMGVVWLAYVTSQVTTSHGRWDAARLYVTGVTLLALLAIALGMARYSLSFWHARQHFGFFPNRNQMSNWLAMAGVLLPALVYEDWGRHRLLTTWWLLAMGIIGVALVMTYSRAGILIYFTGTVVFLAWVTLVRRRTAKLVLGVVAMVVLLTLFLIFGGATLSRFQHSAQADDVDQPTLRSAIHTDALAMKAKNSVFGVGLGNFSAVFALHRDKSLNEDRALHPESDWLWLANEAGWMAVAAAMAGILFLAYDVFPLERGTSRTLRMAAAVAVAAFVTHGFFDVSGHRFGSFLPACFFAMLMIHPRHFEPARAATRLIFRFAGLLVLIVGIYWVAATVSPRLLPVRAGLEKARQQSATALAAGDPKTAIMDLDRALKWSPLDWGLYYRKAMAELRTSPGLARMDFLRARELEPNSSLLPYQEGFLWLPIQPSYAVAAWREGLRRDRHNPADQFAYMVRVTASIPAAREGLKWLSLDKPELFLLYAYSATPDEFDSLRDKILEKDPRLESFSLAQKQTLFTIWADKKGLPSVVDAVQQNAEWKTAAWSLLARDMASRGDYQNAYSLAHSMIPQPTFPQITTRDSLNVLESRARLHPADFATAYLILRSHLAGENYPAALKQARAIIQQKGCPSYFHYLHAEAAAGLNEWQEAWEAMQTYQKTHQ